MDIDLKKMPALAWCLSGPLAYWKGGPGNSCEDCPFRDGPPCTQQGYEVPYADIANDPSESYYKCSLLGEIVWGEYAPCKPEQWQAQARKELGLPDTPTGDRP